MRFLYSTDYIVYLHSHRHSYHSFVTVTCYTIHVLKFANLQTTSHLSVQQLTLGFPDPQCCLDGLDLHRDGREHCLLETVELIKASPSTTLDQTYEYPAHWLYINAFITVEHQHLCEWFIWKNSWSESYFYWIQLLWILFTIYIHVQCI